MEKSKKYIFGQVGYHVNRRQMFLNFSIFLQIRFFPIKYFYQIVLCVKNNHNFVTRLAKCTIVTMMVFLIPKQNELSAANAFSPSAALSKFYTRHSPAHVVNRK